MKIRYMSIFGIIGLMVATAIITWITAFNVQEKSSNNREIERFELRNRIRPSSPYTPEDRDQRIAPNTMNQKTFSFKTERNIDLSRMTPGEVQSYDFNRFAEIASASGDFGPLVKFFDSLSQLKREQYYKQVPTIFSKLGPSHDIREKMKLLDKVNVHASSLQNMRVMVLEREAVERYDQIKEEGILKTLTDEEFAAICRRIAVNRIMKGFEAVEDAANEAAMRVAAATVARSVIAGGTMAASKVIGELPPGTIRDEAVAELVIWLRQTNSGDEANPWEAMIIDEKAKTRANSK